ncbi:hypothetical protein CYY_006510 [Polysphondylium violaceum]|uniref:Uncharacterized protein n=1 Tax=Polysphondylium violaceum TaxID=133409 RepID=A0A8J4V325_9MYCE|nr:hypothetical protein CYY_006510 [Polysphondylium violaceum]
MDRSTIDYSNEEKNSLFQEKLKNNGGTINGKVAATTITPLFFSAEKYDKIACQSELILEAIEIILRLYRVDIEIQSYYPELYHLKDLINIGYDSLDSSNGRLNHFARFDFIENENGNIGIMEFNTATPGGLLIVPTLKKIFESCDFLKDEVKTKEFPILPMDDTRCFLNYLIGLFQKIKETSLLPTIAFVLNKKHQSLFTDMDQFLQVGKEMGLDLLVAGYDELVYNGQVLSYNGKGIDIIWNKFSMQASVVNGRVTPQYYTETPEEAKDFIQAVKEQKVIALNGFPSYFISENKKTLALLLDKRFHHHFTNKQIKAIQSLILPTFVLSSNQDKFKEFKENIIKNKDEYVIKSSSDTRGRAIFIGKSMSQNDWNSLVEQSVDGPFVIQQFIKSKQSMAVCPQSANEVLMNTTLAIFILGGKASGLLSRCSPNLIHNVFSGGFMQVLYLVN